MGLAWKSGEKRRRQDLFCQLLLINYRGGVLRVHSNAQRTLDREATTPLRAISGSTVTAGKGSASGCRSHAIAAPALSPGPASPWSSDPEPGRSGGFSPCRPWARPADFPFRAGTCAAAPLGGVLRRLGEARRLAGLGAGARSGTA